MRLVIAKTQVCLPISHLVWFMVYFQALRLLNYPLQCLVSDDNLNFKLAALKVYPKVVIQTCTNHFKENVRKTLGVRSEDTYREFMGEIEFIFTKRRSVPEFEGLSRKLYMKWQKDSLAKLILLDIAKKQPELLGYTKVPGSPYTTNIIEAYNSHLQGRLKTIKKFENFKHANTWLNAYILKRRLTKFRGCEGKFSKLNGFSSLQLSLQDNIELPNFF